jgi:hypothetical protein
VIDRLPGRNSELPKGRGAARFAGLWGGIIIGFDLSGLREAAAQPVQLNLQLLQLLTQRAQLARSRFGPILQVRHAPGDPSACG